MLSYVGDLRRADVGHPRRARVGAEVLVARRRARRRAVRVGAAVVVMKYWYERPGSRYGPNGVELDAVLAEGVLHPVPVHGLEVVERLRLVEEVAVERATSARGMSCASAVGVPKTVEPGGCVT